MTKCFRPSPVCRNEWQSEKRLSTAAQTSRTMNLRCYPLPQRHQRGHRKLWFISCLKGHSWYFFGFTLKLFSVAPDFWSWSHSSVRCWGTNASLSLPLPPTTSLLYWGANEDSRKSWASGDPCWYTGGHAIWSICFVVELIFLFWKCWFSDWRFLIFRDLSFHLVYFQLIFISSSGFFHQYIWNIECQNPSFNSAFWVHFYLRQLTALVGTTGAVD